MKTYDMQGSNLRVRVHIAGKVQGVGYRYFVQKNARELGLSGWVQNQTDGSVLAEFEGDSADVEQMITLCWSGPSMADVDSIDREELPLKNETEFRVKQ